MMRRAIWSLAVLLGMGVPPAAAEWEMLGKLEPVYGRLGDVQPDKAAYTNVEFYDEGTAKFYSVWSLRIPAGQTLVAEVYSYDFLPLVFIRDKQNAVLVSSVAQEARWSPEAQRNSYRVRLEFSPTAEIDSELLVTTQEKSLQGGFNIVWSLWRAKPEVPAVGGTTTEGGTTTGGTTTEGGATTGGTTTGGTTTGGTTTGGTTTN